MKQKPDEATPEEETKRPGKRFLAVYIIGLFSIALVLILLSYLTQVRAGEQLEAMQSQVTQQTTVAQGATQQMQTLQSTVEEQQKKIEQQQKQLDAIQKVLDIQEEDSISIEEAISLLEERYIALDALQQIRRYAAEGKTEQAKTLTEKMVQNYSLERLTNATGENSVLLGANSVEFSEYYAMFYPQTEENTDKSTAETEPTEIE